MIKVVPVYLWHQGISACTSIYCVNPSTWGEKKQWRPNPQTVLQQCRHMWEKKVTSWWLCSKRACTALGGRGMCYRDPGMSALKARAFVLLWCFFGLQQHHLFLSSAPGGFLSATLIHVSTSRLDAALTYMHVFLACTMSKADTDVLLGSFPSWSAHPETTCRYIKTSMSTNGLVLVPPSSSSLLQRKLETLGTLSLRGLQDLGLQKIFWGHTLPYSPSLPEQSVHVRSHLNTLLPSVPGSRGEHTVPWLHYDLYRIFWRQSSASESLK